MAGSSHEIHEGTGGVLRELSPAAGQEVQAAGLKEQRPGRAPDQASPECLVAPRPGGLKMAELVFRFLIGGAVVSIFAVLAEVFKPKSFAGLFGAAPSIALATIGITIAHYGKAYAATEAH